MSSVKNLIQNQNEDPSIKRQQVMQEIMDLQETLQDLSGRVSDLRKVNQGLKESNEILNRHIDTLYSSKTALPDATLTSMKEMATNVENTLKTM